MGSCPHSSLLLGHLLLLRGGVSGLIDVCSSMQAPSSTSMTVTIRLGWTSGLGVPLLLGLGLLDLDLDLERLPEPDLDGEEDITNVLLAAEEKDF